MVTDKLLIKKPKFPSVDEREILRYAGVRVVTDEHKSAIESAVKELKPFLQNAVIYKILKVAVFDNICDFGAFKIKSSTLALSLKNAEYAAVVCATVGLGADRIISKYSRISPFRAHITSAVATERIEALMDSFDADLKKDVSNEGFDVCKRFSPGYGDFKPEDQKNIFNLLTPDKYIGLTLNDSLIMSPSKSVSAVIGIKRI